MSLRSPEARVAEAAGLAEAIHLVVVAQLCFSMSGFKPATLIGSGKIDELIAIINERQVKVVIVDAAVSPVQQRNLEKALSAKVIDRTGLILEIFGARARTREGRLQVELAALEYQKTRLVRSWTHLERQRGGFGFLGGPGESQLEIDRRLISERIARIKKQLEEVKRTRTLHRDNRARVPYPIVALVGYTNAGKSTLFNRLTGSEVLAKDMLFATLDPTMRQLRLPSGRHVIFSDTVGFISDLPHHLVAAFRATLEEVLAADIVLHVQDISHPDCAAQAQDVLSVLTQMGAMEDQDRPILNVLNKIDLIADDQSLQVDRAGVGVSALTGLGIDQLLARVDQLLAERSQMVEVLVAAANGALLSLVHRLGEVVRQELIEEDLALSVRLAPQHVSKLLQNPDIRLRT